MNAAQLARFKLTTKGIANAERRQAIIAALQWTGRMKHMVLPKWDGTEGRARETAGEIQAFMAVLTAAKDAGAMLTDGQRALVEETAQAAGKVAQQIVQEWPEIWSARET